MPDTHRDRVTTQSRANEHVDSDVRFWTDKLGCTEEQLRAAVKIVGVSPKLARLAEKLLGDVDHSRYRRHTPP